ncbi:MULTISPECIES: putative sulfate exporter family transporter [Campylobacter]|uniref:putative sulfate exporter family transporter n=1 Tax=Campylobacter TaxID=194 RepID=UPI0014703355|nr:putative sulfate exporter family transporter [Campylobacter sp.]MBN7289097.1 putative sulfate exporter family transporter [Campylobacter curvus]MDU6826813.1 putative sulfate exporter family transporter [Campylobacter sp.]
MNLAKFYSWGVLAALSLLSIFLSQTLLKNFHLSPLIIAILLGAFFGNAFSNGVKKLQDSGVLAISTKQILRLGIVLFGFRLTFDDISSVGASGILFAFFIVFSTFGVGCLVGRLLRLDAKSFMLISSGSCVCGAAAVMASQSVLKASPQAVAVAVCTVVVFGTIGMFLYPLVIQFLLLTPVQAGFLTGGSLHEVAHVVAAGAAINEETQSVAVVIKMLRVMMLVPFLIMLCILNLKFSGDLSMANVKANVPYFAIWFLAAIAVGSLPFFPREALGSINFIDTFPLSLAMCALGMGINKNVLKDSGKKPFLLAIVMFVWLFAASLAFVKIFV